MFINLDKKSIKQLFLIFDVANTDEYNMTKILNNLNDDTLQRMNIGIKRKFKKINSINKKNIKFNLKCFNKKGYESIGNIPINIDKLIGAGSNGTVYSIKYKGLEFAIKIMSFADKEEPSIVYFNKNVQEIEFSKMFGNAVINKENPYFPIYYGGGYSDNIEYPKDEEGEILRDIAIKYFKYLINNKEIPLESIEITEEDKNIKNLPFQYMILEMAIIDLSNWIKTYKGNDKNEKLFGFIRDTLYGLDYMHRKGVYHADLHSNNVLILERDCGLIAVMNDFGESIILDEKDKEISKKYLADVRNLIDDIRSILFRNEPKNKMIDKLRNISSNIKKINKKLKNNYIDLIPNIIDEFNE